MKKDRSLGDESEFPTFFLRVIYNDREIAYKVD